MKTDAAVTTHREYLKSLMKSDTAMLKLDKKDPRLILGGSLLRATGLDELPQLVNVLCGEMSLVGPRPCIPYEYEEYEAWQKRRFETLPGLTGLWQVSGKNRTTFNEMIHLDIAYVERQSFWLDATIIFRTVPALVVQVKESRGDQTAQAFGGTSISKAA
jgi:lipopolysaccharide/colanic/teichoic acid biosynthesis glycosyltransferase